jgi:hypothetical protein
MPVPPSESELREQLDGGVNGCSGMLLSEYLYSAYL